MHAFTMTHPVSIRLDKKLDLRLSRLARKTGRTKSFYIKQAVANQLADLEDLHLASEVSRRIATGKERVIASRDVERIVGLDD
jgi:RHH-type transcriptional regulator, rel operon repressor / antitoxin RelB